MKKKIASIVLGLVICVASSVSVKAYDVAVASEIYNCAFCESETLTYIVEQSVVGEDVVMCIHGEGHEDCKDIFTTRREYRLYYCHDCKEKWHEIVEVAWSRTCSCE